VIACAILMALGYFAVADWLYMARLAGYICIAEMPDALVVASSVARPPTLISGPATPIESSNDRDELILSDLPNLALET
jgi:hypothetical protein